MASLSQDSLQACLRIPFRHLLRIAPSSVVDMVVQYHINPNPSYYYMTSSSLPQPTTPLRYLVSDEINRPRPRNSWNVRQEQLYLNMLDHAARNSYPGYNSTINPMNTTPSLNPHATHFQEIDHHLIIDDFGVAEEFEDGEWLSEDVQETATAPDSIVDGNIRWKDEELYKDLKTRRSREEDEIQGDICVVCHDDLYEKQNDDETIATLNCGHEYHILCIKRWLQLKNVCPLCNATALPQH